MTGPEHEASTGETTVRSFLDRDRDAVLARGGFADLFDAYLAHAGSLGDLPGQPDLELMRKALACSVLQLALLPPDQFVAWTLNLDAPPLNVFLAGDNSKFQITGRVYSRNVQTAGTNRLYVETQRPRCEPARSALDFTGRDVLLVMEQYFRRSVQVPTRFFELSPDDFLMVQGLPRVDLGWLDGLTVETAGSHAAGDLETIEERSYQFGCGCDPQKMLVVVRSMFADEPDELFSGLDQVEVTCPRCGRAWLISRREFDARDGELGFS